ncbi:hypothetical protein BDZ91DRAFT_746746 [Kalaharituber pfeilii]|nr:hypothetical protein BDZ91DRAFT_746746 [Kalaharituber pfeilii]
MAVTVLDSPVCNATISLSCILLTLSTSSSCLSSLSPITLISRIIPWPILSILSCRLCFNISLFICSCASMFISSPISFSFSFHPQYSLAVPSAHILSSLSVSLLHLSNPCLFSNPLNASAIDAPIYIAVSFLILPSSILPAHALACLAAAFTVSISCPSS